MKAVLCPVCNGSGKYYVSPCHGCDGRGWVEIGDDWYWYPPCEYPYTYPYYYTPPGWITISEEEYAGS